MCITYIGPTHTKPFYLFSLVTGTFQHCVLLLWDTVIPSAVIILIHLGDAALLIDLRNQAHMADIVLPASLDSHLAAGTDNVVCAAANPDQFENSTRGSRDYGLCSPISEETFSPRGKRLICTFTSVRKG